MAQIVEPASLSTISNELVDRILLYVLDDVGPEAEWSEWSHSMSYKNKLFRTSKCTRFYARGESSGPVPNQYSFLLVNKHLHAAAQRLMHCQSFKILIAPPTFDTSFAHTVSLPDPSAFDFDAPWTNVYPGLSLGKVRDLTIKLEPTDQPNVWPCFRALCRVLCRRRLLPDSPLCMLKLVLVDMMLFGWAVPWLRDRRHTVVPVKAAIELYEETLDIFEDVARLAGQCEVELPYWIEEHEDKARLLGKWEGSIGAKISYNAFPHPGLWLDKSPATRAERGLAELAVPIFPERRPGDNRGI